ADPGASLLLRSFPTRRSSDLFPSSALGPLLPPDMQSGHDFYHVRRRCQSAHQTALNQPLDNTVWYTVSWCCVAHSIVGYTVYDRSEEHTSELQSRENLVCRLL